MKIKKNLANIRENKKHIIHNNKTRKRIGVFISIPKNASTSVRNILELGANRNSEDTSSLIIYENHQRAAVLDKKYDLNNLFVFCFSRNPYDRCVSWYEFHKNMNLKPYILLSFDSWVKQGMPHHWKIQNKTDYIAEGISPLLQYNFVEQYKVDFIGKLENFSRDLMIIIERLNLICQEKEITYRFRSDNSKMNKSNRNPNFEDYYDRETKKIFYSLLEKDFQYFGYEK